MRIEEFYPEAGNLVKQEADTIDFLIANPFINGAMPQLAADAKRSYLISRSGKMVEINSYIDFNEYGKRLRVFLGARVLASNKAEYNEITYSMSVCHMRSNRLSIIRKFHFDIAFASRTTRRPHPLFHIQYCGKLSPFLQLQGLTDNQLNTLHPWLDGPRIASLPMSLALLLDLVFHEFSDYRIASFRSSPEWRNLIIRDEDAIMRPYLQKCLALLNSRGLTKRTLSDVLDVR